MRALVAALVLLATPVHDYDARAYCADSMRAERVLCHAEHAVALAECSLSLAADRWFGFEDALKDVAACRAEADEACRECKQDVFCDTPTTVQP